jgi:hypothetical protein
MARRPNPNRVALWHDRIRRQEASGLTTAQFCGQERCSVSAFYRWKQRLPLLNSPAQPPAIPASSPFLPVTVRLLNRAPGESPAIEADLPNGISVRIPTVNTRLACPLLRTIARAKTSSGDSR